jgi:cytoskeletal protein CcmA (bactofilin family)
MFLTRKNASDTTGNALVKATTQGGKKGLIPSIIAQGMHVLGNIISEGSIDFDGTLDGNVRCSILTIRPNGCIKGDAVADHIYVYGKVKGLIRAKHVHLYASCNVEGIIMHESITIEDGAFVDGKFKRTDKITDDDESDNSFAFDDSSSEPKMLENIRLIR